MDYLVRILEAKIGKSIDFVLDSLNFDTNKVSQFSYLRSPLDTLFSEDSKVFGHCLLIDSCSENLAKYVSAYVKGKTKRPFETSACILVEKKKGQGYNRLLSRFQLLHECKHTYVDACGVTKRIILQVYYDPPQPRLLNSISSNGLTMQFVGKVAGIDGHILVDTAASHCYLSSSYVKRIGLHMKENNGKVVLGNGLEVDMEGTVNVHVKIQQYQSQVSCLVIKLSDGFDLILGDNWLNKHRAHIDYDSKACILHKGNKKITIQSVVTSKKKSMPQDNMLSALQFKRAIKKGCTPILIHLKEVQHKEPSSRLEDDLVGSLVKEYEDIFQPIPAGLPPEREMAHTIPLEEGHKPPFRPIYRLSPLEIEEAKRQVTEYIHKGWIEPSSSPYGSPILFVKKKDGGLRMVIDYRALNKLTIKNRYPLPRIDDLFDQLAGSRVFSSLDLAQGYHQIRISKEDVPKTAFRVPFGHYQFKVLSFGLTNAPATFQGVMNRIFQQYLGKFVLVYLDDILVFSKTQEEHLEHLRKVFEILRENKLFAKLTKCHFAKSELEYLGHVVGKDGIKVDPRKIETVATWARPNDVSQLRSFLGLSNYFRRFIQGYSTLVAPLTHLTRKDVKYIWTEQCQESFEGVKYALTHAPVLSLPIFGERFEVICDASLLGIGAVLLQKGRPIAFESRKLTPAEKNYTTGEQELTAVVHALRTWRCYLEGSECVVITDHNPLTYLKSQQNLSRRQARWLEYLEQTFHYRWEYRPGRSNVADPLSRNPLDEKRVRLALLTRSASNRSFQPVAADTGRSAPMEMTNTRKSPPGFDNEFLNKIIAGYALDPWFKDPVNIEKLVFKDAIWYCQEAIVVPDVGSLRKDILFECHDAFYSGHMGITKTLKQVETNFWWPKLRDDVKTYVNTCDVCQRSKASTTRIAGLLQPLEIPEKKWECVSLDFITGLTPTKQGHDAILVCVDKLSKMAHFIATVTTVTAEETSRLFIDFVYKHHGLPRKLISDRDTRFTSRFWVALCNVLGTKQAMSTAFHPQTDGQTERVNRILEDMLRHYVSPTQDDWDLYLSLVEFAYNNAWQESIQTTPFMLNYGQHPLTPLNIGISRCHVPAAKDLVQSMSSIMQEAKKHLLAAQNRQKSYADRKRREISFDVGTQVLLSTSNIKLKMPGARKLLPRWIGPFKVLKRVGKVAYRLELPTTLKIHNVFHVSLLKSYRTSGKVQPPPPPILEDDELSFDVERVLAHEVRGSRTRPQKFYLIKWLGYGLEHNSWEPEKNLSSEVLKEYWDTVARSQERLTQNKGVESVSVPNKINRRSNHKRKRVDGSGV